MRITGIANSQLYIIANVSGASGAEYSFITAFQSHSEDTVEQCSRQINRGVCCQLTDYDGSRMSTFGLLTFWENLWVRSYLIHF